MTKKFPILLRAPEAAEILQISEVLAYRLMANGDIRTVRISKRAIRVRVEDLHSYISENLSEPKAK